MLADTSVTIQFPSEISLGDGQILLVLLVGVIAGIVAAREVGHHPGFLIVAIIGILGALLGRWGLSRARTTLGVDLGSGPVPELLAAIVGALVLMVLAKAFGGGLRKS
jgi:uncharacterized membrane protein YeaQ/YmgE (transglycosylase-associated protein family)